MPVRQARPRSPKPPRWSAERRAQQKSQASDADASRERDGLFEIVSCEVRDARPHPEERARRRRSADFERACAAMLLSMRGEDARRSLAKRKRMGHAR